LYYARGKLYWLPPVKENTEQAIGWWWEPCVLPIWLRFDSELDAKLSLLVLFSALGGFCVFPGYSGSHPLPKTNILLFEVLYDHSSRQHFQTHLLCFNCLLNCYTVHSKDHCVEPSCYSSSTYLCFGCNRSERCCR